jgi:hypothetical protein
MKCVYSECASTAGMMYCSRCYRTLTCSDVAIIVIAGVITSVYLKHSIIIVLVVVLSSLWSSSCSSSNAAISIMSGLLSWLRYVLYKVQVAVPLDRTVLHSIHSLRDPCA